MPTSFLTSTNALFDTRVDRVRRLSPGFVRITLTGLHLNRFAAHGLDQRIKILVPHGGYSAVFDENVLGESEWRRLWRALPPAERPALRSYTTSAVRPDRREVDLDFYVHERPGPASTWAASARRGERVLVSGPDIRSNDRMQGIQWMPGPATSVLLAGDETAFPAIRGIVVALDPSIHAQIILEVGEIPDAAWLTEDIEGHEVTVHERGTAHGGAVLVDAVENWTRSHGAAAAARGDGFYAWLATESAQVARLREALHSAGISPERVHSQGYWNNRVRAP